VKCKQFLRGRVRETKKSFPFDLHKEISKEELNSTISKKISDQMIKAVRFRGLEQLYKDFFLDRGFSRPENHLDRVFSNSTSLHCVFSSRTRKSF